MIVLTKGISDPLNPTDMPPEVSRAPRRWSNLGWLSLTLSACVLIAVGLEIVGPRIAFPFVDSSVHDGWLMLPVAMLVVSTAGLLWRRRTRSLIDRIGTALVALFPGWGAAILMLHALNAVGDHSTGREARYTIVALRESKSSTYIELAPTIRDPRWPPLEASMDILTPKPAVGQLVTVRVRDGRLGYPWVERYGIASRFGTR